MAASVFEKSFPYKFKIDVSENNFNNYRNGWECFVDITKEIRR